MKTTVIGLKHFRQHLSRLARSAKQDNASFIVTVRNRPVLEIHPCYNEQPLLDETQMDYYQTLEQSLAFWNSSKDENLFDEVSQ